MPEKISIMRDSGETLNSNVVALFTIPDTGKQYIITTENAVDPHGLTVLHVSEIVEDKLKKIATDEEWSSIKTIMRAIISGNVGSYKFIPSITTVNADIQYSRDISVSAAASKQIVDSYMASKPAAPADGGVVVEAKPVEDTNEITPGISEVVAEPAAPEVAPVNVGNAVTNIPADAVISQPVIATPTLVEEKKEDVKEIEAKSVTVEEDTPKKEEAVQQEAAPVNVAPASVVNVQTPVVAYVDPSFQQLLTSDYNQILMHVQSINNNINQIAAMPALNYQPSYSANPNGTPNFNPNATVDEIIMGSTEVFNEGVKNLVATITEKIYRDLYQREAELAKREEVLLEREKMVNEQLARLDAKVAEKPVEPAPAPVVEAVQQSVAETPAAPVAPEPAPVVEAPATVVEAAPAPVPAPASVVEQPVVNVVGAPVKVEAAPVEQTPVVVEEEKVENTVPAQQNTAPVAEPAPVQAPVPPAAPAPEVGTPVVNSTPQPIQTVEIV